MMNKQKYLLTLIVLSLIVGCNPSESNQATEQTSAPEMKMTTSIPHGITTADSVETRLGTLKFTDGFPDDATVEKIFENLDLQRGV